MKIVIDLMGSDHGPEQLAKGVMDFHKNHPDVELVVVGKESAFAGLSEDIVKISANDVIAMNAGPLDVMRAKDSSMYKAIEAVTTLDADGIVSAGSTGAFLSAATIKLKLIPNVERAALVTAFPTPVEGRFVTVLDVGASTENTPSQLVQFAKMGQIYASAVFNTEKPKTYLLNNGAEEGKGTPMLVETYELLKNDKEVNFMGNIEGRDALLKDADVIVSDGFTGNIFLKTSEGIAKTFGNMLKDVFTTSFWTKIGYVFSKKGVNKLKTTMDYKKVGGAMLVGINKIVVKAHGNSNAYAFESALEVAYKMAKNDVVAKIKERMSNE
jgi:glycerol-3-phosphate acyltransferase PlsX